MCQLALGCDGGHTRTQAHTTGTSAMRSRPLSHQKQANAAVQAASSSAESLLRVARPMQPAEGGREQRTAAREQREQCPRHRDTVLQHDEHAKANRENLLRRSMLLQRVIRRRWWTVIATTHVVATIHQGGATSRSLILFITLYVQSLSSLTPEKSSLHESHRILRACRPIYAHPRALTLADIKAKLSGSFKM